MDRRTRLSLLAVGLLLGSVLAAYVVLQIAPLDPLAQFRTADGGLRIPGGKIAGDLQRLLSPQPTPTTYWTYEAARSAYPTLAITAAQRAIPLSNWAPPSPYPLKPVGTDSLKVFFDALLRLPKGIVSFFTQDASAACAGGACYWIGGTGGFSDGAHWATSSGGAACACTPAATDTITFDASSGAGTATQDNATFTSGAVTLSSTITTVNGSTNTWNVGGNWSSVSGTFVAATSTIVLTATGTFTSVNNGQFASITINPGVTTGIKNIVLFNKVLMINGTLDAPDAVNFTDRILWNGGSGTPNPFVFGAGGTLTRTGAGSAIIGISGATSNANLAGHDYGIWRIDVRTASMNLVFTAAGNITTTNDLFVLNDTGGKNVIFDMNGHDLVIGAANIGTAGADAATLLVGTGNLMITNSISPTLTCNSHAVAATHVCLGQSLISGVLSMTSGTMVDNGDWDSSNVSLAKWGSASHTIAGIYTNNSVIPTWSAGTGTVTFTSSSDRTMTFVGEALAGVITSSIVFEFNNVAFASSSATPQVFTFAANRGIGISGSLTISDGSSTTTLNTNSAPVKVGGVVVGSGGVLSLGSSVVNVGGNWDSASGTLTAGTSFVSLNGASKTLSMASGGPFSSVAIFGSYSTSAIYFTSLAVLGTMTMNSLAIPNFTMHTSTGSIALTAWTTYHPSTTADVSWTFTVSSAAATVTMTFHGLTGDKTFDLTRNTLVVDTKASSTSGRVTFIVTAGWLVGDAMAITGERAGAGTPPASGCSGGACFWIGGSGDFSDGAHWATSSGGAACACVPAATDSVTFDGNAGGGMATQDNTTLTTGTVTLSTGTTKVYASNNTWNVGGNWTSSASPLSMIPGTSTVVTTATSTINVGNTNTRGIYRFYNWTISLGITATVVTGFASVGNILTINGTIAGTVGVFISSSNPNPLVIGPSGAFGNNGAAFVLFMSTSFNVPSITAASGPNLSLESSVNATITAMMQGDLKIPQGSVNPNPTSDLGLMILDTNGYSLTINTANQSTFIVGPTSNGSGDAVNSTAGAVLFRNGTHRFGAVSGNCCGNLIVSTNSYVDFGSSTINMGAGLNSRSTSALWNAGTSNVTFVGGTFSTALTWTTGFTPGNEFYNLTIDDTFSSGSVTWTLAVGVTGGNIAKIGGTLTVLDTSGTTTLDTSTANIAITASNIVLGTGGILIARASTITTTSSFNSISGTLISSTSTVVLAGSGTVASGDPFYNLTVNNGVTSTASSNLTASNLLLVHGSLAVSGHTIAFNALTVDSGAALTGAATFTNFTETASTTTSLVTISDLRAYSVSPTAPQDILYTYTASEPGATLTWAFSGLPASQAYNILKNGAPFSAATSSGGGVLTFSLLGSDPTIEILPSGSGGGGGSTPPPPATTPPPQTTPLPTYFGVSGSDIALAALVTAFVAGVALFLSYVLRIGRPLRPWLLIALGMALVVWYVFV